MTLRERAGRFLLGAPVANSSPARHSAGKLARRYLDKWSSDWSQNNGDPNDARPARLITRQRVLGLVSGNPYARKALNTLVNNIVGWGITGAIKGNKGVSALWARWIAECDWNGRLDLYGLQELATRTMLAVGEVFIVFREVKVLEGVPLRLQLLDPGMLATTAAGTVNGIEYDAEGQPLRFHFLRGRPGQLWVSTETVVFDAGDVVHLFVQNEVGQRHGTSIYEPVIKTLGDIDDALEADLVRRKIEACFVAFRTVPVEAGDAAIGERSDEGDGTVAESFEPGMIETLEPGEDIKFGDPKPGGGVAEAVKVSLLAAAAGMGVTYEHLTGDLSNVNYSSYRAGHLEFQRAVGRVQFNTVIPVMLAPIADRFFRCAYERGITAKRRYELTWTPPPFESVDPLKEANGQARMLEVGLESRRNLVNARGYDYDELMAEISTDQQKEAALGLAFSTKPAPAAALLPNLTAE